MLPCWVMSDTSGPHLRTPSPSVRVGDTTVLCDVTDYEEFSILESIDSTPVETGAHSASAESSIAAASLRLSADIYYPGSYSIYSSDGTDCRSALRLPRSDIATADPTISRPVRLSADWLDIPHRGHHLAAEYGHQSRLLTTEPYVISSW